MTPIVAPLALTPPVSYFDYRATHSTIQCLAGMIGRLTPAAPAQTYAQVRGDTMGYLHAQLCALAALVSPIGS